MRNLQSPSGPSRGGSVAGPRERGREAVDYTGCVGQTLTITITGSGAGPLGQAPVRLTVGEQAAISERPPVVPAADQSAAPPRPTQRSHSRMMHRRPDMYAEPPACPPPRVCRAEGSGPLYPAVCRVPGPPDGPSRTRASIPLTWPRTGVGYSATVPTQTSSSGRQPSWNLKPHRSSRPQESNISPSARAAQRSRLHDGSGEPHMWNKPPSEFPDRHGKHAWRLLAKSWCAFRNPGAKPRPSEAEPA